MGKVSASKVVTALEASESPLPAQIQEALGELVGAAREGLIALSVGVGLGVVHELMELEVAEVGFAALDCGERILEGRARHRLAARIGLARRDVGVRSRLALERDFQFAHAVSVAVGSRGVNGAVRAAPAPFLDALRCPRQRWGF